jgi:acyl carrier protein
MTMAPDRDEVVAMLATYGNREPAAVRERIDSLDLAWLVHQVEQRYDVTLDLGDEQLAAMSTVSGAVEVLTSVLNESAESTSRHTLEREATS